MGNHIEPEGTMRVFVSTSRRRPVNVRSACSSTETGTMAALTMDPRARGAPQGHSHHKKYRSQYLATTNARSRERGANALLVLCGNAYAWLATPYMSLQLCIYVCR